MKTIINFSKHTGFKKIKLLDQSNKQCIYNEGSFNFNQPRSLRALSLLRFGETYYGKYGFRPYNQEHLKKYNDITTMLKQKVKEFKFFENIKLKELRDTLQSLDRFQGDDLIKNTLKKNYVDALFLPENQEKIFIQINDNFIKSNCYYESIIRDLIEDGILFPGITSLHLGNFERMELNFLI